MQYNQQQHYYSDWSDVTNQLRVWKLKKKEKKTLLQVA